MKSIFSLSVSDLEKKNLLQTPLVSFSFCFRRLQRTFILLRHLLPPGYKTEGLAKSASFWVIGSWFDDIPEVFLLLFLCCTFRNLARGILGPPFPLIPTTLNQDCEGYTRECDGLMRWGYLNSKFPRVKCPRMEKNLDSFFFSTEGICLTVEERSSYAHMRKGLAIPNRLFTESVRPSEATRMLHTVKRINV